MAVSLKHKFVSAKSDGGDTSLVRPSNWNEEHDLVVGANKLLGRYDAADGAAQEVSVGAGLSLNSSTGVLGSVCRAWVNFDGTSNSANISGTYSQSGTTITVTTSVDHGLQTGNAAFLDFTSGTAADALFSVTVTSSTVFTVTSGTSATTSGNVTVRRQQVRASSGVSSVTDNGVGDYTINFLTPMPDTSYAVVGGSTYVQGVNSGFFVIPAPQVGPYLTGSFRAYIFNTGFNTYVDVAYVNVAFFR